MPSLLGGLLGSYLPEGTEDTFGNRIQASARGENPLFNLAMGLLAQPRYSATPRGPLEGFGAAGMYAMRANQEAQQNQLIREKLAENKLAKEQSAAISEYLTNNPDALSSIFPNVPGELLGPLIASQPDLVGKAIVGQQLSPLEKLLAKSQLKESEAQAASEALKSEKSHSALRQNWLAQDDAIRALDYLAKTPGGQAALNAPDLIDAASLGLSLPDYVAKGTKWLASKAIGVPESEAENVASAVYTVRKAIENISTNEQDAVASQAARARGLGTGAPIDVRQNIFGDLFDETTRLIGTNPKWSTPTRHGRHRWEPEQTQEAAAPDVPQTMQPQTSTVITPQPGVPPRTPPGVGLLPSPPAAEAAPTPAVPQPTYGQTFTGYPKHLAGAPATGKVVHGEAEGKRVTPKGGYFWVPSTKVPGTYDLWKNGD